MVGWDFVLQSKQALDVILQRRRGHLRQRLSDHRTGYSSARRSGAALGARPLLVLEKLTRRERFRKPLAAGAAEAREGAGPVAEDECICHLLFALTAKKPLLWIKRNYVRRDGVQDVRSCGRLGRHRGELF